MDLLRIDSAASGSLSGAGRRMCTLASDRGDTKNSKEGGAERLVTQACYAEARDEGRTVPLSHLSKRVFDGDDP